MFQDVPVLPKKMENEEMNHLYNGSLFMYFTVYLYILRSVKVFVSDNQPVTDKHPKNASYAVKKLSCAT